MEVVGVTSRSSRQELEQLLSSCHVVSLHCPSNQRTLGLIGQPEFALMRRGVLLLNVARGEIIDKQVDDYVHLTVWDGGGWGRGF